MGERRAYLDALGAKRFGPAAQGRAEVNTIRGTREIAGGHGRDRQIHISHASAAHGPVKGECEDVSGWGSLDHVRGSGR